MRMNRRQLLSAAAAAALAAGCDDDRHSATQRTSDQRTAATVPTSQPNKKVMNVGPLTNFASDGVTDTFRQDGFFIIRRGGKLLVLSSVCTHKGCKVRVQPDESFVCKCHGSNFSREGKVLSGPAVRDLPRLKVATDENQNLLIRLM